MSLKLNLYWKNGRLQFMYICSLKRAHISSGIIAEFLSEIRKYPTSVFSDVPMNIEKVFVNYFENVLLYILVLTENCPVFSFSFFNFCMSWLECNQKSGLVLCHIILFSFFFLDLFLFFF